MAVYAAEYGGMRESRPGLAFRGNLAGSGCLW